jgi:ribosomal protein L1
MQKNKRYWANYRLLKKNYLYTLNEAFNIINKMQTCNFKESLNLSLSINSLNKTSVKCLIKLPHVVKTKKYIIVLQNPDNIGHFENLYVNCIITSIDKFNELNEYKKYINSKKIHIVSNSNAMLKKKKQYNIRNISITDDIENFINNNNAITIKSDKKGNIQVPIANESFLYKELYDNYIYTLQELLKTKPSSVKSNNYLSKVFISLTMSPSIPIKIQSMLRSIK